MVHYLATMRPLLSWVGKGKNTNYVHIQINLITGVFGRLAEITLPTSLYLVSCLASASTTTARAAADSNKKKVPPSRISARAVQDLSCWHGHVATWYTSSPSTVSAWLLAAKEHRINSNVREANATIIVPSLHSFWIQILQRYKRNRESRCQNGARRNCWRATPAP